MTTSEPLDQIWSELEHTPPGTGEVYRRLHPDSDRDIRAVFAPRTRQRTLVFTRPWKQTDVLPALVQSRAVCVEARRHGHGTRMSLLMTLSDPAFTDVFSVLAGDVAEAVALAPDDHQATVALFEQLERWRRMLEHLADDGLSAAYRRGLFAELSVLAELVDILGPLRAVEGWTGPLRANQDFQYERCAIEVKSSVGRQPQSIVVANERELDETGAGSLYLLYLSLDERRGGVGASLNTTVDRVLAQVSDVMAARVLLQQRLIEYGYHAHQRQLYDELRYDVREDQLFRVVDGFPRITEAILPEGVGAVRYNVSVAACEPFRTGRAEMRADLVGDPGERDV